MTTLFEKLTEGGLVMLPMAALSVATVACGLERAVFWTQLLRRQTRLVDDVLDVARYDLNKAAEIAECGQDLPIGRFLLAPLRLYSPTPETFRLAMEAAADREFSQMRRGDKLLESVAGIAPLLGLLGTVIGLITTFGNLNIGGGGSAADTGKAAKGIGEALTATATGMVIAVIALGLFRVFVSLQGQQMDYFSDVGSQLELVYRQYWYEPSAEGLRSRSDSYPAGPFTHDDVNLPYQPDENPNPSSIPSTP